MHFMIRITYGDETVQGWIKRFGFTSDSSSAEQDFDKAVKAINKIYHENGRFKTKEEVIEHFSKYGFTQYLL